MMEIGMVDVDVVEWVVVEEEHEVRWVADELDMLQACDSSHVCCQLVVPFFYISHKDQSLYSRCSDIGSLLHQTASCIHRTYKINYLGPESQLFDRNT